MPWLSKRVRCRVSTLRIDPITKGGTSSHSRPFARQEFHSSIGDPWTRKENISSKWMCKDLRTAPLFSA